MKSLYLFATSEMPDPYVNTLSYAVDHFGALAITVVVISEPVSGSSREPSLLASTVMARIVEQLGALSTGSYIRFPEKEIEPLHNMAGTRSL